MRFTEISEEVLYTEEKVTRIALKDIEVLKEMAKQNRRKRIRLCTHNNVRDKLHEMLIVHMKDVFVRPHKHPNKSESWHIIEGVADVIIFSDDGNIDDVIKLGDYASGRKFYYRISDPYYHSLIIRSEVVVFHETTSGPFQPGETLIAPWSPEERETEAVKAFIRDLSASIDQFMM